MFLDNGISDIVCKIRKNLQCVKLEVAEMTLMKRISGRNAAGQGG